MWTCLWGLAWAQSDPTAVAGLHHAMALEGVDGDLEAAASRYLRLSRNLALDDLNRAEALYLLGRVRYDLGQVDEARNALREGIRSGVCPIRCRSLLETIEIDQESVTTIPVVWTFDRTNHGFFHPWRVQDLGSIRLDTPSSPGGDAALGWSTAVQARRPDELVVGIIRPDPVPVQVSMTLRSESLDAILQIVIEDEAGRSYSLPAALEMSANGIETVVVPLSEFVPSTPGGSPLDAARMARLRLVDLTGLTETGDNTIWIYAFALR